MTRRTSVIALALIVLTIMLTGCTGIRERAAEIETRVEDAEEVAAIASHAAAQNTASIRDLVQRIEALEQQVEELMQRPEVGND